MRFFQLMVTASLGGMLFGYDTGVVSAALLYIKQAFRLGTTEQELVTAIVLVGAAFGAVASGSLADKFGRKWVIFVAGVLFVAGALAAAVTPWFWGLLAARLVIGLAIGVASTLTPLYLSELAPKDRRGAVVSVNQLFLTIGILIAYVIGYVYAAPGPGWRWMFGYGAVPGLLLGTGMLFLPESPRWLAGHGKRDQARSALQFIRETDDVGSELDELQSDIKQRDKSAAPWSVFAEQRARAPLFVGIGLSILQQITGINTLIYFAPTIIEESITHSKPLAILYTSAVGLVNVIFTIAAVWLLDRIGRKKLLVTGIAGMGVFLCALAITYIFAGGHPGVLAVCFIGAYVACFAIGLGPVFWLINSEIFPLSVRGRGTAVSVTVNWLVNLVLTLTFLDIIKVIGHYGIFFIFSALCGVGVWFTARYVPETKGRSLEEIEQDLHGNARTAGEKTKQHAGAA